MAQPPKPNPALNSEQNTKPAARLLRDWKPRGNCRIVTEEEQPETLTILGARPPKPSSNDWPSPPNCKDVTSERLGETVAIIGARPPRKPK